MSRSFSLNSLSALATGTPTSGDYDSRGEALPDLTVKRGSDTSEQNAKKAAATVLRRPEPPKALLTAAKNPLVSPLSAQTGNAILGRSSRPSMGTLEEERIRKEIRPLVEREDSEHVSVEEKRPAAADAIEVEMEVSTTNDALSSENIATSYPKPEDNVQTEQSSSSVCQNQLAEGKEELNEGEIPVTPSETRDSLTDSQMTFKSSGYGSELMSTATQNYEDETVLPERRDSSQPCSEDAEQVIPKLGDEDWRKELGSSCYDLDQICSSPVTDGDSLPGWLSEGVSVLVASSSAPGGKLKGWVQFLGSTKFAPGRWVGVELEQPEGKNDGSIKGVRYFTCKQMHGIFVRPDKLSLEKKRRTTKKSDSKTSSGRASRPGVAAAKPPR